MKREMICIGCPLGCQLCAKLTETGEFVSVSANGVQNMRGRNVRIRGGR